MIINMNMGTTLKKKCKLSINGIIIIYRLVQNVHTLRIYWLYPLQMCKTTPKGKKQKFSRYDTKQHLMMRLQFQESVGYPFINITPRCSLTWSGNTCQYSIYGSNRYILKLFEFDKIMGKKPLKEKKKKKKRKYECIIVGNHSQGRLEGYLFNSYYTKVQERTLQ